MNLPLCLDADGRPVPMEWPCGRCGVRGAEAVDDGGMESVYCPACFEATERAWKKWGDAAGQMIFAPIIAGIRGAS